MPAQKICPDFSEIIIVMKSFSLLSLTQYIPTLYLHFASTKYIDKENNKQANCCYISLPPAASLLHLGESKQNQVRDMKWISSERANTNSKYHRSGEHYSPIYNKISFSASTSTVLSIWTTNLLINYLTYIQCEPNLVIRGSGGSRIDSIGAKFLVWSRPPIFMKSHEVKKTIGKILLTFVTYSKRTHWYFALSVGNISLHFPFMLKYSIENDINYFLNINI